MTAGPQGSRPIAKVDPASRVVAGRLQIGEGEVIAFRGRVLAPDGNPAAGAGLYTVAPRPGEDSAEPILRARAARDGTFRFAITREAFDEATGEEPWSTITVLASTDGLGPDWVDLHRPPDEDLVLRLVDDSVPIAGRILDLQGRPVVGAKITRGRINAEGPEGIDPYLKQLRDEPGQATNHRFARSYDADYALPGRPSSITTDGEGRFRLAGIGRDRIVEIDVQGPTIQGATITAMTRDAAPVSMPKNAFMARTVYGARFDHLIGPGRTLTGVVRDRRTGQPLAGLKVAGREASARTTTDAEGRYTLPGFPKAESYEVTVLAGHRPPYFVTCRVVTDTAGLDPLRADVECVPGIPMRLKLIDKETGKAPRRAEVSYWPLHPNPHTREVPGLSAIGAIGPYNKGMAQADGTYLLGVLPGPGAVFVRTDEGMYRAPCVDPAAFFKDELKDAAKRGAPHCFGDRNMLIIAAGDAYTGRPQETNGAIVLVNPPDSSGPIAAEAVLERDQKREVRVLGPDGRPLEGVTCQDKGAGATKTPGVMTVSRLNPMRPKRFTFRHDGRKLVGFLLARGDEPEPYTLRLAPWGTIAGRLLDAQGQPRPGAMLMTIDWQEKHDDPAIGILSRVKTDAEGRFRIEGLVPGQTYTGNAVGQEAEKRGFGVVIDRVVLKPGETRDLGDVRARPAASKGDD
jgi:protocatechuate 3,4-dioxygenase beta subunit